MHGPDYKPIERPTFEGFHRSLKYAVSEIKMPSLPTNVFRGSPL